MAGIKRIKIQMENIIALAIISPVLEDIVRVALLFVGRQANSYISLIDSGLFLICYFGIIYIELGRTEHKSLSCSFVTSVCMIFLFIVSIFLDEAVKEYTADFRSLIYRLPLYIYIGREFCFAEKVIDKIIKFSPFIIIYAVIALFLDKDVDHSMNVSYYILPFTIFSYIKYQKNKKITYLILSILLAFILISSGKRMTLLCYLLYVVVDILLIQRIRSKRLITLIILCLLSLISVSIFREDIPKLLVKMFPNSKSVSTFVQHDFFYSSGRDSIYDNLISSMKEDPIKIRGLYADRVFFQFNYKSLDFWVSDDNRSRIYAHNVFIEILYDFGILLGGFIVIVIILKIINMIKILLSELSDDIKRIIVCIFSFSFAPTLVSRSFLVYPYFGYLSA